MTVYGISKSGLRQRTPTNDSVLVRQSDIDKHMKHSLQYLDNLKKQLDFHATKASSIRLRKEWLQRQKK